MTDKALYEKVIKENKKPVDEWFSFFYALVKAFNPGIVDAFVQDHDRFYRIMFDACLRQTLQEIFNDGFAQSDKPAQRTAQLLKALNPKVFNAVESHVEKIESMKDWRQYTEAIAVKLGRSRVDGYRATFDACYEKVYGVLIKAFELSLGEQLGNNAYEKLTPNVVSAAANANGFENDDQFKEIYNQWFAVLKEEEIVVPKKQKTEEERIYDNVTDQIKKLPIEEWKNSFVSLLSQLNLGKDFVDGFLKDYDYRHQIDRGDKKSFDDDNFNERVKKDELTLIDIFTSHVKQLIIKKNYKELRKRRQESFFLQNGLENDKIISSIIDKIEKYDVYYPIISRLSNTVNNFSQSSITLFDIKRDASLTETKYYNLIIAYFQWLLEKRFKMAYGKFRHYTRYLVEFLSNQEDKWPTLTDGFKKKAQKESEEEAENETEVSVTRDMEELARLRVENVRLRQEKSAYQTLAEQRQLEIRELQKLPSVNECRNELEKCRQELDIRNVEYNDCQKNYQLILTENIYNTNEVIKLKNENDNFLNTINELEEKLKIEQKNYQSLQDGNTRTVNNYKKLEEKNQALANELDTKESEVISINLKNDQFTQKNRDLTNALNSKTNELNLANERIEDEERKYAILISMDRTKTDLVNSLNRTINELKKRIERLEKELGYDLPNYQLLQIVPIGEPINSDESSSFEEQPDF